MRFIPFARVAIALSLGSLGSCGPAVVPPANPSQTEPVPVVLPLAEPSASAQTDAGAPDAVVAQSTERVAPLADPACQLALSSGKLVSEVRLQIQGQHLASLGDDVQSANVQMSADGAHATAQIVTSALRLEAEVDLPSLRVGSGAPAALLDGWLQITRGVVTGVSAGKAIVAMRYPTGVTPVQSGRTMEIACSELTLYESSPSSWAGKELSLKQDGRSDMRIVPGGAVVARVAGPKRPRDRSDFLEIRTATVLAERAGQTQVRIIGHESAVVGWIDARALEPKNLALIGLLGGSGLAEASEKILQCSSENPLFAEVSGKIFRVGELRAGAKLPAQPRSKGGYSLKLDSMSGFFLGGLGSGRRSTEPPPAPADLYLHEGAQGCVLRDKGE